MKDLKIAAGLLNTAKKVIIVTDYDYDGCSCNFISDRWVSRSGTNAVIIMSNNKLDRGINSYIMQRVKDEWVEGAIVITGDTGSGDLDAWRELKASCVGWRLIVTDHHIIEDEAGLKEVSLAIVNAQRSDSDIPTVWSGANVLWETYKAVGNCDLDDLAGWVAMANLVDQMDMSVYTSIESWKLGYPFIPKYPVVQWALKEFRSLIPHDRFIVMRLAPVMNSCQRFSRPDLMVRIMKGDIVAWKEALVINAKRKKVTKELLTTLKPQIRANKHMLPYILPLITFGEENKPYCGLIASSVARDYSVPVIVWNIREGGEIGGSARTIGKYPFQSAIKNLQVDGIGTAGHEGAFGIWATNNQYIKDLLTKYVEWATVNNVKYDDGISIIETDILSHDKTVLGIDKNRPYGNNKPYPVFSSVVNIKKVKRNAKNISIFLIDDMKGGEIECLMFDVVGDVIGKARIEYSIDIDVTEKYIVNTIFAVS